MNPYEYQRSRSFTDLGSRSLETAKPIEAKFHLYSPWDEGTKVYANGLGHMIHMAAMPIYDKNP